MEETLRTKSLIEMKELTINIQKSFSRETEKGDEKWMLLKTYYEKYLLNEEEFDKSVMASFVPLLSTLLDSLKPTLFLKKWHERLYDDVFLQGILHESFLILVKGLDRSEDHVQQKVIRLLVKFTQKSAFERLFFYQCISHKDWDLKYVSQSNVWDDLITAIVSLPERIANRTKGKFIKVFSPAYYLPLILSSVNKVLETIYVRLKNSQDSSLEFLAKLTGKICIIGNADIAAKMFLKKIVKVTDRDYLWRRISQNFISKMPSNSLDSFIRNLLLQVPWYGYVDWILGDAGLKNEKINYIMTFKLLFLQSFKQVVILQNVIGYFVSSPDRVPSFIKILESLLDSWADERVLKHQSSEQKMYIALALMTCAGWLKQLKLDLNYKDYINKVLKGTQVRLGSSEETVRHIGMIVGGDLIKSLDPDSPPLEFDFVDVNLVDHLRSMLDIPSKPDSNLISIDDVDCFVEVEAGSKSGNDPKEKEDIYTSTNDELDSDDDLEPYDMSNDVPQSELKRPLYLRDCMMGLMQQDNVEWTEQCLKYAEELIKANPYGTEEIAEEMTKILLHMTDGSSFSNFVALRHRVLIALTVQSPIVVANYLTSQFCASDYTIRQRLDILEVLAASSALLARSDSHPQGPEGASVSASNKEEADWQIVINQRLKEKTKLYTKAQYFISSENKFSAIARNFFYPLLNSYEKARKILKFGGNDSYVLGRFIFTLGIIMCSASNTLHCTEMGTTLLQFLSTLRSHDDVFVRQSVIFAIAATFTAVPPSLLFSEVLTDASETVQWLQSVAESDCDKKCVEKAVYALSIFESATSEGLSFYSSLEGLKSIARV